MDKTKYTVALGGNSVSLTFNWGTVRRLKGFLNADPLLEYTALKDKQASDIVDFAMKVVASAAKMELSAAEELFDELAPGDATAKATEILGAFNNAFTTDEPAGGGTGANTQPGQAANLS